MIDAIRAIAKNVLAAETEIGSVRVTDRPLADMPVKPDHRPDPPRSVELLHDRLSLGAYGMAAQPGGVVVARHCGKYARN